MGFPGGAVENKLPAKAGDARDMGSIPGSGTSPGGGNGNSMDRGAWQATVHRVAKSWSDTTVHMHVHTYTHTHTHTELQK